MNYKLIYDKLIASGSKEKFPLSHGHHIIPKHIGGTDDEWNFVFLTVRQHALAHRLLWKIDGRWQDKVAWQGLSGRISCEETISAVIANSNRNRVWTEQQREKLSMAKRGKPGNTLGTKRSDEARKKLSEIAKQRAPDSEETRLRKSEAKKEYWRKRKEELCDG